MDILKKVSDTITDKSVSFNVDIKSKGFKLLRKIKLLPQKKKFEINALTLGTLLRISKLILKIDKNAFKNNDFLGASYKMMVENSWMQAQIIALAVTNCGKLPDKKLVYFFMHNITSKELNELVTYIVRSMDIENFIRSIVSIRGIQILETSPRGQVETIAPGVLSAVS